MNGERKTILAVSDYPSNLTRYEQELSGYIVRTSVTSPGAIKILKSCSSIVLLIADFEDPRASGELILDANRIRPEMRYLLVTDRGKNMEAGEVLVRLARHFITVTHTQKPIDADYLLRLVRLLIGQEQHVHT